MNSNIDICGNEAVSKDTKITYHYYTISCLNVQTSVDMYGRNFISANYHGLLNHPNIQYSTRSVKIPAYFQAAKLYIFGKLHDIPGLEHDGELIIEHNPVTSMNTKIYNVFLLKKSSANDLSFVGNSLNALLGSNAEYLEMSSPVQLDMSEYIPVSGTSAMIYDTADAHKTECKVIINKAVIPVTKDLKTYSKTQRLFIADASLNTYSPNVELDIMNDGVTDGMRGGGANGGVGVGVYTKESFTVDKNNYLVSEGASNDIFECDFLPVDSDDTVKTLQIPVDSKYINSSANQEFTDFVVNNILYFFLFIFALFISPMIYFNILKPRYCKSLYCISHSYFYGYSWIDVIISSAFLSVSLYLIIYGNTTENTANQALGLNIALIYVLGFIGIFLIKNISSLSAESTPEKIAVSQEPIYGNGQE
jgi:hypothetical protein